MLRTLLVAGFLFSASAALSGCASEPLDVPPGNDAPPPGTGSPGPDAAPAGDYALTKYPPGPYGLSVGSVIENLEFLGWHDPVAANYDPANFEVVRLSDYYDPSGAELKLLVLNASAVWCSVCRVEYRHIKELNINATYRPKGVQLLGALFEDIDGGPARPEDLSEWASSPAFSVEFPMLLDPGFKLGRYFTSDVTPLNLIIDARTMRIIDTTMGYDPSPSSSYWALVDALLAAL